LVREELSHRLFVLEGKKSVTERRAVADSNRKKDMDLVKEEKKSRLRNK